MNITNLLFFDKNGESYNFNQNANGYWEGADYFLPISTALFDNSNLFILEAVTEFGITSYKFPTMEPGSRFDISWKTADAKTNFFLFTITREGVGPDSLDFITKAESLTINHSDFGNSLSNLDLAYPFQVNVAFTPIEERAYSRVMQIHYTYPAPTIEDPDAMATEQVLELTFYGEGEDEDERMRVWLENFGIRFNREDALLLKDYDLKESLSDWARLNAARKQLLVNQDQVYPYVGTYKGMLNLISLLGYRDVLRVKEYWRDTDPNSNYYNKFAMVDVTDLMQLGDITKVNLIDDKRALKNSKKFKKTEFLALVYEFTVATDNYDDDGLPEVVPTTEFTVDEIFFKLHGVAKKLETEILPVNVVIRDIIGEFIYFEKFNLRNWIDLTTIEAFQVNDVYKVNILEPNTRSIELKIRDIKTLYPKLGGVSEFPAVTYSEGPIEPYQDSQVYPVSGIPVLNAAIAGYYEDLIDYEFRNGPTNPADYGDDALDKIGCPTVLEAFIPDLTLQELDGVMFNDFIASSPTTSSTPNDISTGTKYFDFFNTDVFSIGNRVKFYITTDQSQYMEGTIVNIGPGNTVEIDITYASGYAEANTSWTIYQIDTHYTINTLRYRNGYEIEWKIEGPQNYLFIRRGVLTDLVKMPHILPHTGAYTITASIFDMQGGVSFDRIGLTVKSEEPVLQVFTRMQDKFRYDFNNLSNITIEDLGQTPLFDPMANVVNPNGLFEPFTQIQTHYLDWYTYSNYWSVGGRQDEALISYPGEGFVPYRLSSNPAKKGWGSGSIDGQPTLSDYAGAKLNELYHLDFSDLGYVGDTLDGFYIDLKLTPASPGSHVRSLQFGGFPPLDIATAVPGATLETLTSYLQSLSNSTKPGWSEYSYQIIGGKIKATAKQSSKLNHSIIKVLQSATVYDSLTASSYPIDNNGLSISDPVISASTLYTFTELFESPTVSETSGLVIGSRVRVQNQDGGWVEGIITDLTTALFEVRAQTANVIGDFTQFEVVWADSVYTFGLPKRVFSADSLLSTQQTLAQMNLSLDEDLLFVYSDFTDKLKTLSSDIPAPASNINYWIDNGYVTYDTLPDELYVDTVQVSPGIFTHENNDFPGNILPLTGKNNYWEFHINEGEIWTLPDIYTIRIDDSIVGWENGSKLRIVFDTPVETDDFVIEVITNANASYEVTLATLTQEDFAKVDGVPSRFALTATCDDAANFVFTVDRIEPVQKGFIPSQYDENSFTLSNIKATQDTIQVPIHHPIFVTISNLASNVETEWTLVNEVGDTIINVRSPAYFIWRFEKPGSYKLLGQSTDTRNNTSYMNVNIAVANVLSPAKYVQTIEKELNERKRMLTHA
jgi:hypothetical protein